MDCNTPVIISFTENSPNVCMVVMNCGCQHGLSMDKDNCQICGVRFDFNVYNKEYFIGSKLVDVVKSHYKLFEDGYAFEVECRTIITDKGEFKVMARYGHEKSE